MSVAVETTTAGHANAGANTATSFSTSFTVTSANALLVTVTLFAAQAGTPTATWDSGGTNQAMTLVAGSTANKSFMFAVMNPVVGTKTLQVSWGTGSDFSVGVIGLTGVLSGPVADSFIAAATNSGASTAASVSIPAAIGDGAVGAALDRTASAASGISNTTLANINDATDASNFVSNYLVPTTTNTTVLSYTVGAAATWTYVGVRVLAATTGPIPPPVYTINETFALSWIPPQPGPIVGPVLQPYQPARLSPPISGPPPQNPPFNGPKTGMPVATIVAWWPPPPGPDMGPHAQWYQQPQLTPPSGPPPQNPPFPGPPIATEEIQISWIPPPPDPIFGPQLNRLQRDRIPVGQIDPATRAIINAFTTPPTDARIRAIDALVVALKSCGAWSVYDVYYRFNAADSQSATINWKNPGTFNAVPINSPSFVANQGFATDGSSSFLTSQFTPSSAGGNYALNSAHLSVWSLTSGVSGVVIGATGTSGSAIIAPRFSSTDEFFRINDDDGSPPALNPSIDSSGQFVANRSGSTAIQGYRNGATVTLTNPSYPSTALPDDPIFVLAWDGQALFATAGFRLAGASIGGSLTASQVAAIYAAELAYAVAVGTYPPFPPGVDQQKKTLLDHVMPAWIPPPPYVGPYRTLQTPPSASQSGNAGALFSLFNSIVAGQNLTWCDFDLYTVSMFNGQVLRFTTADFDINVNGVLFSSQSVRIDQSASKAQAHWKIGFDVDTWTVVLMPRPTDIVTGSAFPDQIGSIPWIQAAHGGFLDNADVQIDRAYFSAMPTWPITPGGAVPTATKTIFAGKVAQIDTTDLVVVLTLNDYRDLLSISMPLHFYGASCRHNLFDVGCNADGTMTIGRFMQPGVVKAGSTRSSIMPLGGLPNPGGSGTYTLGTVTMTSGQNLGFSRTVAKWDGTTLQLVAAFPFTINPGDTFNASAGCDLQRSTCTLFGNLVNFGGQPYIPAPEVTT